MPTKGSSYPADWLRIADKDLKRVKRLLEQDDAELAGFCLQQGVEKLLKAFLLSKGWRLRRTHNLDTLLDDAVSYDNSLETFRTACQKITAFYFLERYPVVMESDLTLADVRGPLDEVEQLIDKLRSAIPP